MKNTFSILGYLILSVVVGPATGAENCSEVEYSSDYNDTRPVKNKPELVHSEGPLLDNGKVTCEMSTNYGSLPLTNHLLRIESGEYKGVKYRYYYSDGSGGVQGLRENSLDILTDPINTNWTISCKVDGMDDTAWCSINKDNLTVTVWKDKSPIVIVGNSHFPSTNFSLRVDGSKVFETLENNGFSQSENVQIVEKLKSGESVLTRYIEWPYKSNIDKETDLFGFSVAYELATKIRENIISK